MMSLSADWKKTDLSELKVVQNILQMKSIKTIKSKKAGALVLVILLVCLIGGITDHYVRGRESPSERVIFSIDGKNYDESEVQTLIRYPVLRGEPQNQMAQEAFSELKQVKAAENLGYSPSSTEIAMNRSAIYTSLKVSPSSEKKYNDWFTLSATVLAINNSLGSTMPTGYSGYSYVFFFGQHLQAIPGYTISGFNNPQLIAQDKAYAKQRANYYYQQLKDNKITPAKALTASIADMRSRGTGDNNLNYSVKFTPDQSGNWSNAVYFSSIIKYVSTLHKTGLSSEQVGKAANNAGPGAQQVSMYYYFVYLNSAPKGNPITSQAFNEELNALPARYMGFKS